MMTYSFLGAARTISRAMASPLGVWRTTSNALEKRMCTTSNRLLIDRKCEQQLNLQIGNELSASHTYLAMAAFCTSPSVALPGMAGYCLLQSDDERVHAGRLMALQILRGGRVTLPSPDLVVDMSNWTNLTDVINGALCMEQQNLIALKELVNIAEDSGDALVADSIISGFLNKQYKEIHELETLLARLRLAGDCVKNTEQCNGAYLIDLHLTQQYQYKGLISFDTA